ncbi:MAG: phospho-N-acetylmuramoyl-pentapeptide-transferase [Synergistales bacterium]|nr:phospho-N-acetylmuramoyl-pentapeptide-transferase [Synergistales bacterium]
MITIYLFCACFVFIIAVLLQETWIHFLKRIKAAQTLKSYGPKRHLESKKGTPTMGGVLFPITFALGAFLVCRPLGLSGQELLLLFSLPTAVALIGFIDDWLKFKRTSSEGLRSLQKLSLQILFSLPWTLWICLGRKFYLWPDVALSPWLGVPLLLFLTVGVLNAVNITDGLDGLASGAFALSMGGGACLLGNPWATLCFCGAVTVLAFLWHTGYPAKVFMGDVGAHFLGGLLITLCVLSDRTVALFPLGFLFGLEALSVVIQLVSIWVRGKKVFLMSPIHHHFELKGWSETEIVTRFWLIHFVGMTFLSGILLFLTN